MNPHGTAHTGESHYRASLTDAIVRRLRKQARTAKANSGFVTKAAEKYGVSVPAIIRAVKGDTWRHLPGAVRRDLRYDRKAKRRT